MLKKWFDWTARDIAAWEAIRARGLARFILGYGVCLIGSGLFLLLGLVALLLWLKDLLLKGTITALTPDYLQLQGVFLVILALAGGLVTSLATWVMEEIIYRKIYRPRQDTLPEDDISAHPQQ